MVDLAARIAVALGQPIGRDDRLAVAVSGGADSLALLQMAAAAFAGRITAITVDHGLRAGSAAEATGVAAICAGRGVPHVTLRWPGPHPSGNIQAEARAARYDLMADWCARHETALLLTAHHADDQAETLLMRLARGSGSGGLAGIRARRELRPGVMLVRPLLGMRRAELAAVVAAAGWVAVLDPANADPRYDRTAARQLLLTTPWLDADRLAAAAAHLADAEAALDWAAARAWAGNAQIATSHVEIDVAGLPDELVRRLVAQAIRHIAPDARPDGGALVALARRLAAGGTGTLAGVAARGGYKWLFRCAPPRRDSRRKAL